MPLYYFHIRGNGELIKDREGVKLPTIRSVREEIRRCIVSVLEEDDQDEFSADREFQIEDEGGRTVLTVPFRLAFSLGSVSRMNLAAKSP